jgi:HK97 family phage portal protein
MAFMFPGSKVSTYTDDYIHYGYEDNPTVFGVVNKIVSKSATVPIIPMVGEKKSTINPLTEIFPDGGLIEFRKYWHLFRLLLGESMVYFPMLKNGNNAGKPMQLEIMPPHLTDIEIGTVDKIVKYFRIQTDNRIEIDPSDVYHSRCYLNLDFKDGKQLRGISPLKVASNIIQAMNSGEMQVKDIYTAGMPPFALVNEDIGGSEVEENKIALEKAWRNKAKDIPLLAGGKLSKIDFGFNNLKDMQIIDTDKRGLKIICNIWGVHESLFTAERATMDNMTSARKLMYEDRILPDVEAECEMYNYIFKNYGITYKVDTSSIPALQEDKEKIARILTAGIAAKAVTKNEFRIAAGLEELPQPEFGVDGLIDRILFEGEQQQQQQSNE